MKDSICCWAILIPGQEQPLHTAGLRLGLVFYWDSIQTLESHLHP